MVPSTRRAARVLALKVAARMQIFRSMGSELFALCVCRQPVVIIESALPVAYQEPHFIVVAVVVYVCV